MISEVLIRISLHEFPKNARENNIVNQKMVVKFTILVPYYYSLPQSPDWQNIHNGRPSASEFRTTQDIPG